MLEGAESVRCFLRPAEGLLLEEAGEGRRDDAVVADELPVVACEAEEAPKRPQCLGSGQA